MLLLSMEPQENLHQLQRDSIYAVITTLKEEPMKNTRKKSMNNGKLALMKWTWIKMVLLLKKSLFSGSKIKIHKILIRKKHSCYGIKSYQQMKTVMENWVGMSSFINLINKEVTISNHLKKMELIRKNYITNSYRDTKQQTKSMCLNIIILFQTDNKLNS